MVVGILVYLLDRQPSNIYFIPDWFNLEKTSSQVFGGIGYYLPTFIHTLAFILLTAAVVHPSRIQMIFICISWLVIEALFEVAQISLIAQWIANHVPSVFLGIPFLENTTAYFIHGTFDYLDLVSILAGAVTAYLATQLSQIENKYHVHET